ncbi:hypothetical protein [Devosia sp.]|uniref:hypothetical protein n=1 Tax=Devosia sp. TaxID=1871048 RepID=UPI0019DDAB5C|nr:hypothetical protein [Devosia sp.]MBE0578960.1 hypothetical protein [Devosia sp.]
MTILEIAKSNAYLVIRAICGGSLLRQIALAAITFLVSTVVTILVGLTMDFLFKGTLLVAPVVILLLLPCLPFLMLSMSMIVDFLWTVTGVYRSLSLEDRHMAKALIRRIPAQ